MPLRRRWAFFSICVSTIALAAFATPQPRMTTLQGTLHRIVGDPVGGRGAPMERWVVTTDHGALIPVRRPTEVQRNAVLEHGGARVSISAETPVRNGTPSWQVRALHADAVSFAARSIGPEVTGDRPWIVLLCQLAEQQPFAPPSAIRTLFTNTNGGLSDYFREVSDQRFSPQATVTDRWYALPKTEAGYGGAANFDLLAATRDCLSAVDADVHFPRYAGIMLQFTGGIGASGYGGPLSLVLDGLVKRYAVAWLSGGPTTLASYPGVYAHEIGHGLGLLHSYQKIGADYGSQFDVMSGSLLVHPIAYQKLILGWIAPERVRTLGANDRGARLAISRSALPSGGATPLALRIPLASRSFLTIEARERAGYDQSLVNTGVVVHHVARHRGVMEALMIDANADPDDGGSGWRVGQRFDALGVVFTVDSIVGESTWVTIVDVPSIPRSHTLTLSVNGAGMVREGGGSPNAVCAATCTVSYIDGDVVSLEADPDSGMTFTEWTGDCTGAVCNVSITRDLSVTATFVRGTTIAIGLRGRGRVVSTPGGITCDWRNAFGTYQACGWAFAPGAVTLQAMADSGHFFSAYAGAGCSGDARCTLSPATNVRIAATFAPGPTVHTRISGVGRVFSPALNGSVVDCYSDGGSAGCHSGFPIGTQVALSTQSLSPTYSFVAWTGACGGTACVLTMNTSQSIGAVFASQPTVFAYDSVFVRHAAFRASLVQLDSTRVALGGPGAPPLWRASTSGRVLSLARASGRPFEWLVWRTVPEVHVPGWNVDSIRLTADGVSGAPSVIIDSVFVRADATLARTRSARVDTIVEGLPGTGVDSVLVRFLGRDSLFIPWTVSDWSARYTPLRRSGIGDGTAAWKRGWDLLRPGTYGDSLVLRAGGVRDSVWIVRDSVVVVRAPTRSRALADLFGRVPLSQAERLWMDRLGNDDATFNLGDVLAFLKRELP